MPLFLACLLAVGLCLVRSASAADVDTAPFMFVFGSRAPSPPGSFRQTVQSAAHDASGSVYVVESTQVQKFDRDGALLIFWSCVACAGIDVNQVSGDVYVTAFDQHLVRQYTENGVFVRQWGTRGVGNGQFVGPHGIGVDPTTGEVYVFDSGNGRVQVFDAAGVYLRQFGQGGIGAGDFSGSPSPGGVCVDSANQLVYVTDPRLHRLFKFATDGTFLTKWGDPSGTAPGRFRWPRSVEVDGQGRVYVTDTDSERIQYFENDGTYVGQFQGPHNVIDGAFHPRDIAINRLTGEKYVNAAYANREDKFDASNAFVLSWGTHDIYGPRIEAPHGIAVSPTTGDVFLFDSGDFLMKRFSAGGAFINQWGGSDRIEVGRPGLFGHGVQSGVTVATDGRIWVGLLSTFYSDDVPGPWLQQFEPNGSVASFLTRKPVTFNYEEVVRDVAIEPTTGDMFVADGSFRKLRRVTPEGVQIDELAVQDLAGLTFVGGKLYAADPTLHVVRRYDEHLGLEATIGGPGGGDGRLFLRYASGVAVDANGRIFVADSGNHRISQFDADGAFRAKRGSFGSLPGQFVAPMDVALSPTGDLLYVADTFNHRVQVLCLGLPETCDTLVDDDADSRRDLLDNCPFVANQDQADSGGIGSATPDGTGDACQCGDVNADNQVTSADIDAIRAELAEPGTLASSARCSVAGGTECDVNDVALLARALASLKPKLLNVCSAAGQSGP